MNPKRNYRVGREGTVIGTFNEPELVYLVSCGKVLQDDDCWTDGMPSWAKIASVPELRPQANMNPRFPDLVEGSSCCVSYRVDYTEFIHPKLFDQGRVHQGLQHDKRSAWLCPRCLNHPK